MRARSHLLLLGSLVVLFAALTVWAVSYRLRAYSCPWIAAGIPRVKLGSDGVHLSGAAFIRNTGRASATDLQWSYYVLLVPPNDPDKDVYLRMQRSDSDATALSMEALPEKASRPVLFDSGRLGSASFLPGGLPTFLQADHYVRLMFTYHDSHHTLHHTYRCYQVAERPNRLLSVWRCPQEDVSD